MNKLEFFGISCLAGLVLYPAIALAYLLIIKGF